MKKIYVLLFVTFVWQIGPAQTTILTPSDDMSVNEGSSGMTPDVSQLWIANYSPMQNYHQAYLKFDLTEFENASISDATLNLYQFFHAPDGSPTASKIYAITEDWNESDWPYTQNISIDDEIFAEITFTSELGWYQININNLVSKWLSGEIENYGLAIIANSGTKFSEFYSKDHSDSDLYPYLEFNETTNVNTLIDNSGGFKIFPNPTSDFINIKLDNNSNDLVKIEIFNTLGKLIYSEHTNAMNLSESNINISSFDKGIYFVRVESKSREYSKKFIRK